MKWRLIEKRIVITMRDLDTWQGIMKAGELLGRVGELK